MVAPDGAVSFADDTTFSVTRLKDGVFTPHDLGQLFATPFGVAVAPDGTVWATVQNTNKLVRSPRPERWSSWTPRPGRGGLGDVAVDGRGTVWVVEMRANRLGRYADGRFTEFAGAVREFALPRRRARRSASWRTAPAISGTRTSAAGSACSRPSARERGSDRK